MTRNDLKKPRNLKVVKPEQNTDSALNRTTNEKSNLKGGGNIEINDNFLDETLHNNNL